MASFNTGQFINTFTAINMMRGTGGGLPGNDPQPRSGMRISNILFIIGFVFVSSSFLIDRYHPNYQKLYYDCKVLDKIQTDAGYKVSAQFILVVQTDGYPPFSIYVDPTTYSQADKGEILTFKLLVKDITDKWPSPTIHFIEGFLIIIGIALFVGGLTQKAFEFLIEDW